MATNVPAVETGRTLEGVTAAVVGQERNSAQADVRRLQLLAKEKGEQEMFKAEMAEKLDDKQPNFPEIYSVLSNIPDATRRTELQNKAKLLQEIVEKKAAGTILAGATPDAHVQFLGKVAAGMPGMVAAIAKETGQTITSTKTLLENGNFNRASAVGKIIDAHLHNESFLTKLRSDIGGIEQTENQIGFSAEIATLDADIKARETNLKTEREVFTNSNGTGIVDIVQNLMTTNPSKFNQVKTYASSFKDYQNRLKSDILAGFGLDRPSGLKQGDIVQYQTDALAAIRSIATGLAAADQNTVITNTMAGGADNKAKAEAIQVAWRNADRVKNFYTIDANFDGLVDQHTSYMSYQQGEKARLDKEQADINKQKIELAKKRATQDKEQAKFGQKIDRVLNKSYKDYYNDEILKEADRIAQLAAQQKGDEEKKAQELKEKQKTTTKEILDKYLYLSVLKYKNGRVVGWDDAWLKKFVKQDMLSRSPAQLTKDMAQYINRRRIGLPREYAAEMQKMMNEMGVTTGPPPVSFNDIINGIDQKTLFNWACEKVPDVLGYASHRHYYFDRLKISKAQGEFLRRAYIDTDFFRKAADAKQKYEGEAEKMLGTEFVNGKNFEAFKKEMGGDWVGGTKKAMKTMAVLGALGAGAFGTGMFLTGGMGSALASGSLDVGLKTAATTLGMTGEAIKDAAIAGSNVAGTVAQHVAKGTSSVAQEVVKIAQRYTKP